MLLKLLTRTLLILWPVFILATEVCLCQSQEPNVVFVDPNISIQKWVGKRMPIFSLSDKEGNVYNNKSVIGKIVVFNLWSIYCHPCIDEIPLLNSLVERYSKTDIVFLAPAPESSEQINNTISKNYFKYIVLSQAQSLFKSTGLIGYPYHIIIDRQGFVKYIHIGTKDPRTGKKIAETELIEAIEKEIK